MGKYTRKPKTSAHVSAMDVSQSSTGVRTRAKTLALQRLQSDYIELRSRRLHKPPLLRSSPKIHAPQPRMGIEIGQNKDMDEGGCFEIGGFEIEASLGENDLDMEIRERSTRESTPCSLIWSADTVSAPGSSTKQRSPTITNQRAQNSVRNIPTTHEVEEFFARAEQPLQQLFIEKYNFDIVNDLPLPGRYEWHLEPRQTKNC